MEPGPAPPAPPFPGPCHPGPTGPASLDPGPCHPGPTGQSSLDPGPCCPRPGQSSLDPGPCCPRPGQSSLDPCWWPPDRGDFDRSGPSPCDPVGCHPRRVPRLRDGGRSRRPGCDRAWLDRSPHAAARRDPRPPDHEVNPCDRDAHDRRDHRRRHAPIPARRRTRQADGPRSQPACPAAPRRRLHEPPDTVRRAACSHRRGQRGNGQHRHDRGGRHGYRSDHRRGDHCQGGHCQGGHCQGGHCQGGHCQRGRAPRGYCRPGHREAGRCGHRMNRRQLSLPRLISTYHSRGRASRRDCQARASPASQKTLRAITCR
jgi:hypothetical protein